MDLLERRRKDSKGQRDYSTYTCHLRIKAAHRYGRRGSFPEFRRPAGQPGTRRPRPRRWGPRTPQRGPSFPSCSAERQAPLCVRLISFLWNGPREAAVQGQRRPREIKRGSDNRRTAPYYTRQSENAPAFSPTRLSKRWLSYREGKYYFKTPQWNDSGN